MSQFEQDPQPQGQETEPQQRHDLHAGAVALGVLTVACALFPTARSFAIDIASIIGKGASAIAD
jgi:hypothetical protein